VLGAYIQREQELQAIERHELNAVRTGSKLGSKPRIQPWCKAHTYVSDDVLSSLKRHHQGADLHRLLQDEINIGLRAYDLAKKADREVPAQH
jgi:hypothetical protein